MTKWVGLFVVTVVLVNQFQGVDQIKNDKFQEYPGQNLSKFQALSRNSRNSRMEDTRFVITMAAVIGFGSNAIAIIQLGIQLYELANPVGPDASLINDKLDAINTKLDNLSAEFHYFMKTFEDRIKKILLEFEINQHIQIVKDQYRLYEIYSKNLWQRRYFNNETFLDFAKSVTSKNPPGLRHSLNTIHRILVDSEKNLLYYVMLELKDMKFLDHCALKQSPQQSLYNFYVTILATKLQGFVVQIFGYTVIKLFTKVEQLREVEEVENHFETQMKTEISLLKTLLAHLSQDIWRCDPNVKIEGETYFEVTRFMQGILERNDEISRTDTCLVGCGNIPTPTKEYRCKTDLCKFHRRCTGNIYQCEYFSSNRLIYFAIRAGWKGSDARYSSIEAYRFLYIFHWFRPYRYPIIYIAFWGTKCNGCSNINVLSPWRTHKSCDYCSCVCDEQGQHSDRYFNLRPTIADIENNRVVTGLRFAKKNRIIHLQIQEGELIAGGVIDNSTVRWVPVDDYKLDDANVTNGQDYYTLDYYHRAIGLDDVRAKKGEVVIGVKIRKEPYALLISMLVTTFNFTTGILDATNNERNWRFTNVPKRHELLNLADKGRSIYNNIKPSVATQMKAPMMIKFTYCSMRDNVRQFTVPALDAQPVESVIPVPLAGVGLYHKRGEDRGGYVAPKIITYDYSRHFED